VGVIPSSSPIVSYDGGYLGGEGVGAGFGIEVNDAEVFEFWEFVKSCVEVVDVGL
jgi:hypothetical protein